MSEILTTDEIIIVPKVANNDQVTDFIKPTNEGQASETVKITRKVEGSNPQNYTEIKNDGMHIFAGGDEIAAYTAGTIDLINHTGIIKEGTIDIYADNVNINDKSILPKTFSLTPKSGYTITDQNCKYIPALGLVVINARLTGAYTSGVKEVASVPADYKPVLNSAISVYRSEAYWVSGYVNTDGVINVRSNNSASNQTINLSAVYWI